MKRLETVNLTHLSVLEFGQHIKSILTNIGQLGKNFVTDAPLIKYLKNLETQMQQYDKAMLQVITIIHIN